MAGTISTGTGLASNINWSELVTSLVNAQKARSLGQYERNKTTYETKLSAWQSFNNTLLALTNYVDDNDLAVDDGYALYSASLSSSSTDIDADDILTVSMGDVTGPGNYSVEVTALAEAEKIASDQFSTKNTALGLSGDLVINGKVVTVDAADTLGSIAAEINSAGAGATATVLTISEDAYRLLIESESTGAEGLSLKNGSSGNILESLNLHSSSVQLAHGSGLDALSDMYTNKTGVVGTLLGLTSAQSGTVRIRGTDDVWKDVSINLGSDSLDTIVSKINGAAATGVTASVEEVTENGTTYQRIKLTNVDVTDFEDQNNVLETIGIVEGTRKNTIRSGQDATVKIDTYTVTSSSNTVTDVIPGVTLTLTATNTDKPVELSITQNDTAISEKVSTLVQDINTALTFIKDQNTYVSGSSKPLMGDINLSTVRQTISTAVFSEVIENTTYTTASSIGITFGSNGTLSINTSTLTTALSTNREETLNVLKGLSDSLYDKLNLFVDPYTGTFTYIKHSLEDTISNLEDRIAQLNERFEREAEALERRFAALELLISKSNLTKNWLTQQTDYMSNQGS
jgi:flagellar hook-associated protein 2